MTHLVVNPDWTIPIPVILKETVKYVLQDPCYFRNNKMVILRKQGEELVETDPATINWGKLTEKNLDFLIRQVPGPENILGRLKFVFPNKYDIFLHDTPYQEDFAKAARAYSHGCIRAEKPVELAVWVLRGKPGWDLKQIYAAIENGEERTVKLVEPINVYFLYSTAWAGEDGAVQFRPDIYERDKKLIEALGADPTLPRWPAIFFLLLSGRRFFSTPLRNSSLSFLWRIAGTITSLSLIRALPKLSAASKNEKPR
jgi:murein L,D-transpeptidase YcbB/YkuD